MHEMSLVRSMVDIVLSTAGQAHAGEVAEVDVTVGEGRDIDETYMGGLFSYLARGTIAEHARLVVSRTPIRVRCEVCGEEFGINVHDQTTWACPSCGAYQRYRMVSGMEFSITRLAMRLPMPAA